MLPPIFGSARFMVGMWSKQPNTITISANKHIYVRAENEPEFRARHGWTGRRPKFAARGLAPPAAPAARQERPSSQFQVAPARGTARCPLRKTKQWLRAVRRLGCASGAEDSWRHGWQSQCPRAAGQRQVHGMPLFSGPCPRWKASHHAAAATAVHLKAAAAADSPDAAVAAVAAAAGSPDAAAAAAAGDPD